MKHYLSGWKKVLGGFLAVSMLFSMPLQTAWGATYYEQRTQQTVTRGVSYEHNSRIIDAGVQDIHVLKVDLTESTLSFHAVSSPAELGLKQTVKKLLEENGAVAGVNGDFFGLSGSHSAAFGPEVTDGEPISAGTSVNQEQDEYAAFFMDKNGNPFFDYFKMNATFSNGRNTIELSALNKVTAMVYPVYLDRQAAASTAQIDARFNGLVKIIVQEEEITYISSPGEVVQVPEDGYLIMMSSDYRASMASGFQLGDGVYLDTRATVNLDQMETAFGGGGKLLIAGAQAPASNIVATGRQPRTAFGVSQDGRTAIFMVVDGRGDSIGATHAEMAALMSQYGAYEAMHLDGGGSSTMVADAMQDGGLTVKNTVSEGSERNVINAVGIFQNADMGEIQEIIIVPSLERTVIGRAISFSVYGLDEYYNKAKIPVADVTLSVSGVEGTWSGYDFTPAQSGNFAVTAVYNDFSVTSDNVVAGATRQVRPATSSIALSGVGERATIATQVVDTDGFSHWVSSTTSYEVANTAIGTMNGNVFTATAQGATYIKCTRDGQVAYISVTVGGGAAIATPGATFAADPLLKEITGTGDGAYYINIIGALAYSGDAQIHKDTYVSARSKAKTAADRLGNVLIFGGKNDTVSATTLDPFNWTGGYRFLNRGGASVVMVSAANGGILNTNPTQWANFTKDIEAAGNDTIVFVMDKTPSHFTSAAEANYFRGVLSKYVAQGKTVFVVSCESTAQWTSIRDGVRYINLPDLWRASGEVNENFSMLQLRVNGSEVSYSINKI